MGHLDDYHKTSDMALVSYLRMEGCDPQGCRWESGTCHWIFRVTPALLEHIDCFSAGDALVEPKEYNRVFGATKREFHDSNPDDHH